MTIDPIHRFTRQERWRLRGVYLLYQVVVHLLLPIGAVALAFLARKEPLYGAQWWNRLGFVAPRSSGRVFVFAASLGETRAATPLVHDLLDRGETILITHSSASGLAESRRAFATQIADGRVIAAYVPFDLFWALAFFFARHRPKIGLVLEAELWPALLMQARRAGVPMFQVNGNYTERAFKRDSTRHGGVRLLFWRLYHAVLTKSLERAERYKAAGVPPECVHLVGELKFDQRHKPEQIAAGIALRDTAGAEGAVLGIASSIEGEEAALMHVIQALRQSVTPPPRIVWVPRSPQRFAAVAESLRAAGIRTASRSQALDASLAPKPGFDWPEVLVGDSIGEMDFYYSLCDVVFVGATLYPMGGHNIVEPLGLGKPVVTGPSIHGILFPAIEAMEEGAMRKYDNEQAMATDLAALFSDPAQVAAFAARTGGFNSHHLGATARTIALLSPYLENADR